MDIQKVLDSMGSFITHELFRIGETPISFPSLFLLVVVIIGSRWVSKYLQKGLISGLAKLRHYDAAKTASLMRLVHYSVLILGALLGLQAIGIDLSLLLTASAVFAIGFGFAMQNIAQNFVSGIILLLERAINPGDIIEVEGGMVQVKQVRIRTTLARTLDEEDVIIPNTLLVQNTVKNYTYEDQKYRIRAVVGVAYGSDMKLVRETLTKAATNIHEDQLPKVVVILHHFSESSVDWEVSIWTSHPWSKAVTRSVLLENIWWAFKEQHIEISFPQLVVHFPEGESSTKVAEALPGRNPIKSFKELP